MSDLKGGSSTQYAAVVRPRISWLPFTAPAVFIFFAIVFFVSSVVIAPFYIGESGTTTATILSSPNYHPVVSYTVDGVNYTATTTQNNPLWAIGDQIGIAYNPKNPDQASTTGGRTMAVIFALIALAMAVAAVATGVPAVRKRHGMNWVLGHGQKVEADITQVIQKMVHVAPTRYLTRIVCEWTSPNHVTHTFRSNGRRLSQEFSIADLPMTTIPVYIDPGQPDTRYYVDDAMLPPGKA